MSLDLQLDFDRLFALLQRQDGELVRELVVQCLEALIYASFAESGSRSTREDLLTIYASRAHNEQSRPQGPVVVGHEELLPALSKCGLERVCVSELACGRGTYIVFTDYDKTQFIGLLRSPRTYADMRAYFQRARAQAVQQDLETPREHLFVGGRYQGLGADHGPDTGS